MFCMYLIINYMANDSWMTPFESYCVKKQQLSGVPCLWSSIFLKMYSIFIFVMEHLICFITNAQIRNNMHSVHVCNGTGACLCSCKHLGKLNSIHVNINAVQFCNSCFSALVAERAKLLPEVFYRLDEYSLWVELNSINSVSLRIFHTWTLYI